MLGSHEWSDAIPSSLQLNKAKNAAREKIGELAPEMRKLGENMIQDSGDHVKIDDSDNGVSSGSEDDDLTAGSAAESEKSVLPSFHPPLSMALAVAPRFRHRPYVLLFAFGGACCMLPSYTSAGVDDWLLFLPAAYLVVTSIWSALRYRMHVKKEERRTINATVIPAVTARVASESPVSHAEDGNIVISYSKDSSNDHAHVQDRKNGFNARPSLLNTDLRLFCYFNSLFGCLYLLCVSDRLDGLEELWRDNQLEDQRVRMQFERLHHAIELILAQIQSNKDSPKLSNSTVAQTFPSMLLTDHFLRGYLVTLETIGQHLITAKLWGWQRLDQMFLSKSLLWYARRLGVYRTQEKNDTRSWMQAIFESDSEDDDVQAASMVPVAKQDKVERPNYNRQASNTCQSLPVDPLQWDLPQSDTRTGCLQLLKQFSAWRLDLEPEQRQDHVPSWTALLFLLGYGFLQLLAFGVGMERRRILYRTCGGLEQADTSWHPCGMVSGVTEEEYSLAVGTGTVAALPTFQNITVIMMRYKGGAYGGLVSWIPDEHMPLARMLLLCTYFYVVTTLVVSLILFWSTNKISRRIVQEKLNTQLVRRITNKLENANVPLPPLRTNNTRNLTSNPERNPAWENPAQSDEKGSALPFSSYETRATPSPSRWKMTSVVVSVIVAVWLPIDIFLYHQQNLTTVGWILTFITPPFVGLFSYMENQIAMLSLHHTSLPLHHLDGLRAWKDLRHYFVHYRAPLLFGLAQWSIAACLSVAIVGLFIVVILFWLQGWRTFITSFGNEATVIMFACILSRVVRAQVFVCVIYSFAMISAGVRVWSLQQGHIQMLQDVKFRVLQDSRRKRRVNTRARERQSAISSDPIQLKRTPSQQRATGSNQAFQDVADRRKLRSTLDTDLSARIEKVTKRIVSMLVELMHYIAEHDTAPQTFGFEMRPALYRALQGYTIIAISIVAGKFGVSQA